MTESAGKAHHNNFGALRLLFAYAVILSHSPEMLDGNPAREPLMALGLHVTFGGLAVYGFFIISGYLVASSYLSSRSLRQFLTNRILRIYPAFLIASALCVLVVGPITGGALGAIGGKGLVFMLARALLLFPPELEGALKSLPIPALDGSMWTIRYEFRCYLIIAILGASGLLNRRGLVMALTAAAYAMTALVALQGFPTIPAGHLHQLTFGGIGDPAWIFQLVAIFMSGVCARLYRDRLTFNPRLALICGLFLCAAVFIKSPVPEIAIGTAGAYLLLWTALGLRSNILQKINNSYDFSYGVYLYAWPLASLTIFGSWRNAVVLSPWDLTGITCVLATIAGAISWYLVERPALTLKSGRAQKQVLVEKVEIPT